jgi:hypothetical protein
MNDRFNISFQRQLPYQIVTDVTYFVNFGSSLPYVQNVNMMDPNIGYTNKSAIDKQVANPFYNYLTPDKYPGPNRNQKTVALKTLLVKYPQYGNVFEAWRSARGERYHALQLKVQRPFRNGYNFMFGYNYNREREEQYFNDLDTYNQKFTYIPGPNPHHRISIAGTYEFPFGQGRQFLATAPKAVDMILGGWQIVGAWYFNTGNYLRFNPALASGDPTLENPTPAKWFDTSVFRVLPAYTSRENPWQYPGLTGPTYWDMQASVSKIFKISEGIKAEFKFAAFNLTNRLNRADPDMVVTSSTFGQALRQSDATKGRQLEYSLRIRF